MVCWPEEVWSYADLWSTSLNSTCEIIYSIASLAVTYVQLDIAMTSCPYIHLNKSAG